ncbi:hypothetical protein KNU62_gp16 [Gordonia phage Bakery]|uniref:Uncharacterized protein n=1 Tax=Gordonia phage Bakery TaxID=2591205 RepID=A0A514DGQ6_9CAUD|nr:hypothetical protein KNU62_gp16 [Gordonia phage Bakery]QDH92801.1 hypothetical protein SEA_BAKERY_16 [Gordonia phage Bakery]
MIDLDRATEVARLALPQDRAVRSFGWAADDGTIILSAPHDNPDRDNIPGLHSLVRVTTDGEVTSGTMIMFMDDISAMTEVGDWPTDL